MVIVEGAEERRDIELIGTVTNADSQLPRSGAPHPSRHHRGVIRARDDVSGFLEKESPCFGHLDAAIGPPQKTRLHLVLEPPNLMAQGRLCDSSLAAARPKCSDSATATKYRKCRSSMTEVLPLRSRIIDQIYQ